MNYMPFENDDENKILTFGYKLYRNGEIFTVSDWGNIQSHIHQTIIDVLEVLNDDLESMKVVVDKTELFTEDRQYNNAIADVSELLSQTLASLKEESNK